MKKTFVLVLIFTALPWSLSFGADNYTVGDTVPAFHLPYATSDTVAFGGIGSEDLKGERYVLAFFPAAWSSGCTSEMCTFRDEFADFKNLDVTVMPVSGDYVFTLHEWAKYHKLPFMLLGDQTREFGKRMGVLVPERGMFKRSVFVVGPDGTLQYVDYDYSLADDSDYQALKKALRE